MESGLRRGLLPSGWNQWMAATGRHGAVRLEGVKVDRLSCYLEGYRYHSCRDSTEEVDAKRRRGSLLQDLRVWKPGSRSDGRYRRRVAWWSEMARDFLCELYSLRQVVEDISLKYFDGHQLPFPAVAEGFARLVGCIEELVEGHNQVFANRFMQQSGSARESQDAPNPPDFFDASALEKEVSPAVRQHTAVLVDMARAEALDAMGETLAATHLIERHIQL